MSSGENRYTLVYYLISWFLSAYLLHEGDELLELDRPRPVVVNLQHLFVDLARRTRAKKMYYRALAVVLYR